MMTRTAFVTGATGFIGRHLVERLIRLGWDVTALCLPTDRSDGLREAGARVAPGNINDAATVDAAMSDQPDAVFHMAANTSSWSRHDAEQYRDNVLGTANMLEVSRKRRAARFVYTSSISAFGYHPGLRIDEATPSNASTAGIHYGKTKYEAERLVKYAAAHGLPAVILNPVNVLGPYDRNNWTRLLIRPAYDGRLRFVPPGTGTWAYVADIVAAHVAAVERGASGANYLLGGVEASFAEVATEIDRLAGRPRVTRRTVPRGVLRGALWIARWKSWLDGKEPFLTPERYKRAVAFIGCDDSRARRDLGYQHTGLPEMLGATLRWVDQDRCAA